MGKRKQQARAPRTRVAGEKITIPTVYPVDLQDKCEALFAPGGRLSTAIPEFVARPQQSALAKTISEAILQQSTLVIEAGTGTGKTFAYLIPI